MLRKIQYQAGQLQDLLEEQRCRGASGLIDISAFVHPDRQPRTRVLVFNNGEIVYGGMKVLTNQEFARQIGVKCSSSWADTAVRYAAQKLQNPSSFRELLEHIVRIRVFKWEDIEAFVRTQVAQVLEQTNTFPGQLEVDNTVQIDLSYGLDGHKLNWYMLLQEVGDRQKKWDALAPIVPSMEAVPQILSGRWRTMIENSKQQHLLEKVNGKRSLIEIAEELDQDPLELAQYYKVWSTSNLLSIRENTFLTPSQTQVLTSDVPVAVEQERPIVLSVDDSPVVQALIKRALVKDYQVFSASNAVDALKLMNTHPIILLLLDVTMPEIDGLEFCRTVRSIPKFKQLPIVMVTARDKFSDKLRGQIAGTTHYLTKPFEPEALLKIVAQCVKEKKHAEAISRESRLRTLGFQSQTTSSKIF
ncbi:two-component system response regulator [Scytonema hofmannii PCC 7110]|uniref:Two-component system response regulator n=1 Tax=Scytonema hofmannii PCC 7110 TaxID=128403 RepID=A0A139XFJ5_9CYAN|nr:response regulator [Scytonema hofmannii]KYC43392.1 two-component system response regulator [Scytonema hofmannii PCC 7110]